MRASDCTWTKGPERSSIEHRRSVDEDQDPPDPTFEAALAKAPCESAPLVLCPAPPSSTILSAIGNQWLVPERRARTARLVRYAATSMVAFAVSEATLLILYGSGVLDATVAACVANLVGTVPSYFMSRYWIWRDASRSRVGRQVVLYWSTSIACIAGTSLATGAIANLVPTGHRFHLAIVGIGFLVVSVTFWLAKFVIYQRLIFPAPEAESGGAGSAGLTSSRNPEPDDDELLGQPPSRPVHDPLSTITSSAARARRETETRRD
jgi:putative flippase GtrA